MRVQVRDLKPNPFRDMKRYPIDQAKVDTLAKSIKDTSFWDNILARKTKDGEIQIAYGHHRLLALRKALGLDEYVDIPVRSEKELTDEQMIKIMANENMREWESNALIDQETIRAAVLAYAEDKIELEKPNKDTNLSLLRYAPSFIQGAVSCDELHPYTAGTVADGPLTEAPPPRKPGTKTISSGQPTRSSRR